MDADFDSHNLQIDELCKKHVTGYFPSLINSIK